jgi:NADPH-dependent glutamate synthase beta subunit-like oxidoreductase
MESLGVKIQYGKSLSASKDPNSFTFESLKRDGYEAVFCGVGRQKSVLPDEFKGLSVANNFWTSKEFLPLTCTVSKPLLAELEQKKELPKLHGRVIVLGGGDVAADCAGTAFRFVFINQIKSN